MTASPEDHINKNADKLAEENRVALREAKKLFKQSFKELKLAIKKNASVANYIHGSLIKYEKTLKEIKSTNENVEETLANVLLAIRQNEYLQAWHPEQHEFPAMKVTGKHPAKGKKIA